MPGDEAWKTELTALRETVNGLNTELLALKKSSETPQQSITEMQAAVTTLRAELKTLQEAMPDNKAAQQLVVNMEAKITELAGKVATLTPSTPLPNIEDQGVRKARQKTWV